MTQAYEALFKMEVQAGNRSRARDLYASTQPVSGRHFYGRERLLVELADALHSGEFLGIYGLRKMGKTSLVYQLRDEQLRHDAVAYVDLQASRALNTENCAPLYWEVERALHRHLSDADHDLVDLLTLGKEERFSSLPDGGVHAPVMFAEDLRAFLDAIVADQAGGINHLVILLDELERILPVAGQRGVDGYLEFFGLLRGLAQTERYRGLLSCVVVAANAAISERGYWEGRENPVFALYKPFFIPPLPENEWYRSPLTSPRSMVMPPDVTISDLHPNAYLGTGNRVQRGMSIRRSMGKNKAMNRPTVQPSTMRSCETVVRPRATPTRRTRASGRNSRCCPGR